jgi:hypothetical protein
MVKLHVSFHYQEVVLQNRAVQVFSIAQESCAQCMKIVCTSYGNYVHFDKPIHM